MKKLIFGLLIAIMLAGGAVAAISAPAYAQAYQYPPPPADPYASPWVGPATPWVYYNGDWFLNGILYFFFGPQYGWCPYYAYPYAYIVRPHNWYGPMWQTWYRGQPQYWQRFERSYPYWRNHREGHHYDRRFYDQHHRGQGVGWQEGFRGKRPEGVPGGHKPPPHQVTPPPGPKPGPTHVAPPERQKQAPSRVIPPEAPKPAPSRVAPPAGPQPGPSKAGPPAAPKSGPAAPAPAAPKQGKSAPAAPQPEKGGHGEGKH